MTGKPTKPGDDQQKDMPEPQQHTQGSPSQDDPTTFGNIDPDGLDAPE